MKGLTTQITTRAVVLVGLGAISLSACGTGAPGTEAPPSPAPGPDIGAALTANPAAYWNNATIYFLLTDRFYNGDPSNDLALGRAQDEAPFMKPIPNPEVPWSRAQAGYSQASLTAALFYLVCMTLPLAWLWRWSRQQ